MAKKKSLGDIIRYYRKLKDLSQGDLGEMVNLSYQAIQKLEYNKSKPKIDNIVKISKALELPVMTFFDTELQADLLDRLQKEFPDPEKYQNIRQYKQVMGILNRVPKRKRQRFINLLVEFQSLLAQR
jgi:transcriptional regulator with XRE-family HTH domain